MFAGPKVEPLGVNGQPVEVRRVEENLGVLGLEDDEVVAEFDLVLGESLAEPFEDSPSPLTSRVADELRADGVGDRLLDGVGVNQAG